MNQTLLVTEYVNERCAVDYGLPRSPGFIFDPNYIVKKGKIRDSWQMFWKDVFSDSGSGCFDDIYDGEHWLNPDDTNTILRLCQTDAELISGDRSLPCESPDLIPKLRPYQKAAVQWMLQKEKNSGNCFVNFSDPNMHPLFQKVTLPKLQITSIENMQPDTLFLNAWTGQFSISLPLVEKPTPGGVLADEMGLGKTLEILDLILKNKRDAEDIGQQGTKIEGIAFPSEILGTMKETGSDVCGLSNLNSYDEINGVTELACVCGNVTHDPDDRDDSRLGTPVKCSECDSWMHFECVSYREEPQIGQKRRKNGKTRVTAEYRRQFVCPFCVTQKMDIVKVKTTLIVSPSAICNQWMTEIDKHVIQGSLKALNYTGVSSKQRFIWPSLFQQYDVVITTFETLRAELLHTNLHEDNKEVPSKRAKVPKQKLLEADPHPCRLRRAKRYRALPSPLPCVEWWRVCVDEAQQIECHTARATEMLLKLHAVNRWCVTGTPIRRNIEDIYGLMLFLKLDPLYVNYWWAELVLKQLKEPILTTEKGTASEESEVKKGLCNLSVLMRALKFVIWRTSKDQVRDQICIPKQHISTNKIRFSPIESHFYNRKKEKCARRALELLRLADVDSESVLLNRMDREISKKILSTVGDLRKSCIHPQMVMGAWGLHGAVDGAAGGNNRLMTMGQLLGEMKSKAVRECEETVRQICSSLNGIAGLKLLQHEIDSTDTQKLVEAVAVYRDVLLRVSNYALEGLRVDALPRIHSLFNLHIALHSYEDLMPKTMRDATLLEECRSLKLEYLAVFEKDVVIAHSKWNKIHSKITEIKKKIEFNAWLAEISECVVEGGWEHELVDRVYTDLQRHMKTVREEFRTVIGLEYFVYSQLEEVKKVRDSCCTSVNSLNCQLDNTSIAQSYHCHLKLQKESKRLLNGISSPSKRTKKCKFCVVQIELQRYERLLFDSNWSNKAANDNLDFDSAEEPAALWKPSRLELVCASISAFTAVKDLTKENQDQAKHVKSFLVLLREEFKELRDFWRCLTNRVAGHDELRMATERFRLYNEVNDGIMRNEELSTNVLKPHMWAVFACGHSFCLKCLALLLDDPNFSSLTADPNLPPQLSPLTLMRPKKNNVKCPLCRKCASVSTISFVTTENRELEVSSKNVVGDIKGDLSAKTHELVKLVKGIIDSDATAKVLIFSSWNEVLTILAYAFELNEVPFLLHKSGSAFQGVLNKFKRDNVFPVLLLPYKSSSSGLNIIEANHVIIVEPVLNPAVIHQAIGRVDRISQCRETYVHFLLIENSVEDKLCQILPQFNNRPCKKAKSALETTPPISLQDVRNIFT
ncbi:E3 ubiquitin-protein ligase SHPRH-like isoform X2 [Symsagittifera roscoffensis]|uniref:E3 ubiquitin-protein ligase SHPRH-like isoform X2 n=1 Tax=Symsagittifera roscoffensis TaxID=84072 RepID=UPI00307BE51E